MTHFRPFLCASIIVLSVWVSKDMSFILTESFKKLIRQWYISQKIDVSDYTCYVLIGFMIVVDMELYSECNVSESKKAGVIVYELVE